MPSEQLRPMCFIAMPFGKRKAHSAGHAMVDFDRVHTHLCEGAEAAGLETIRADFELAGGFIHKPMLERLLVAEYVIADLTFANPNVIYEVGVRHGSSARATLLVCADRFVQALPFDFKPFRVLTYAVAENGSLLQKSGPLLAQAVFKALTKARQGQLPIDNPIMQITAWKPAGGIEHSKTDVFLQRLQYTGRLGEQIKTAILNRDVDALVAMENNVIQLPTEVSQVHTAILGVYLGYRELKAYQRMTSLFERMPKELQQTAVAREQYSLALNRLAESAVKAEDFEKASSLRRSAIAALDEIPSESVTSETYGIRGRIYKAWHDALRLRTRDQSDPEAKATLQKAIETYEEGFRKDIRDSYPGVNAVTLRLLRGTKADRSVLKTLLPVVRFSVECALVPKNNDEKYWQTATKLELATADEDWKVAKQLLTQALGIEVAGWLFETTARNLQLQKTAFASKPGAGEELEEFINVLSRKAEGK
jgi:tetratricopeptide (TPR) repeat protein